MNRALLTTIALRTSHKHYEYQSVKGFLYKTLKLQLEQYIKLVGYNATIG
jgi:hypothetical protein